MKTYKQLVRVRKHGVAYRRETYLDSLDSGRLDSLTHLNSER